LYCRLVAWPAAPAKLVAARGRAALASNESCYSVATRWSHHSLRVRGLGGVFNLFPIWFHAVFMLLKPCCAGQHAVRASLAFVWCFEVVQPLLCWAVRSMSKSCFCVNGVLRLLTVMPVRHKRFATNATAVAATSTTTLLLTHPLTHSPTHPLTHSPTHPLTHSPTHPPPTRQTLAPRSHTCTQPFLPADHAAQAYFPDRSLALTVPGVAGVILLGGIGVFVARVVAAKAAKDKSKKAE
jgi:hypothetical protein